MWQEGTQEAVSASWRAGGDADVRLRRKILAAANNSGVLQDQIDCAELALEGGLRGVAEMLYGLVFLQTGFSGRARAMQAEVIERTGLWSGLQMDREPAPPHGFSVDIGLIELRDLMRLRPVLAPPSHGVTAILPAPLFKVAERRLDADKPLIALCHRVSETLRSVPRLGVEGGLAEVLIKLVDDMMMLRPIRLHEHLGFDTFTFAALYGLDRLRQFLLKTEDLLKASPSGPALFDAAARLEPAALGPFFSNLRYVLRDARDLFALIDVAGDKPHLDEVERWCVLMSGFLSGGQTLELVDELGDRGMRRALFALLARIARSSALEQPFDIVWRIRDAGLDMGDFKLAEDAQHLVATWTPKKITEWIVMGDIRATAANAAGAEDAYGHGLMLQPDNPEIKDRLSRLRAGSPSFVDHGYGTSPGRLRLRRARLTAFAALREQRFT